MTSIPRAAGTTPSRRRHLQQRPSRVDRAVLEKEPDAYRLHSSVTLSAPDDSGHATDLRRGVRLASELRSDSCVIAHFAPDRCCYELSTYNGIRQHGEGVAIDAQQLAVTIHEVRVQFRSEEHTSELQSPCN